MEGASASLSSLSSQVSRCQGPCLTPSLANYLRADLIAHVTGWPAEILEKQVFNYFFFFIEPRFSDVALRKKKHFASILHRRLIGIMTKSFAIKCTIAGVDHWTYRCLDERDPFIFFNIESMV